MLRRSKSCSMSSSSRSSPCKDSKPDSHRDSLAAMVPSLRKQPMMPDDLQYITAHHLAKAAQGAERRAHLARSQELESSLNEALKALPAKQRKSFTHARDRVQCVRWTSRLSQTVGHGRCKLCDGHCISAWGQRGHAGRNLCDDCWFASDMSGSSGLEGSTSSARQLESSSEPRHAISQNIPGAGMHQRLH